MFENNLKIFIFLVGFCCSQLAVALQTNKRLVCYYDASSSGNGKWIKLKRKNKNSNYFSLTDNFQEQQLMKALPHCTHLMYGYAHVLPHTLNIGNIILKPEPAFLKSKFPHLKIFLSLGGDRPSQTLDYLNILESDQHTQNIFVINTKKFLISHQFDGIDLAFPLPRNKPHKVHDGVGLAIKRFKKFFTGDEIVDPNSNTHKEQYTNLVIQMWMELTKVNMNMAMTVLPNVNSTCK